jgi:hypothetical protein
LRSYSLSDILFDERMGLQLLLVLAKAVILGSESFGTNDHILLSQIRDSPTWRARCPYLYPPGTGWPSYTPRHWVPFSSSPTVRRATVEVFEPASTRGELTVLCIAVARTTQNLSLICKNRCVTKQLFTEDQAPIFVWGTPHRKHIQNIVSQRFLCCYRDVFTLLMHRDGKYSIVILVFVVMITCFNTPLPRNGPRVTINLDQYLPELSV